MLERLIPYDRGSDKPKMHPGSRRLVEEVDRTLQPNHHLPEVTRGGVLIEPHNPQPEVRKNAEGARDWQYAEQAAFLYRWSSILRDELLDPVLVSSRQRLPDPVIGFDPMRIETLAAYTLVRNPQGLLYEITFNVVHMRDEDGHQVWEYGQYGQLETLLHEMIHLWQQNFGQHPIKLGKVTHNAEFVRKCEYFGLHPRLGSGAHAHIADGLFEECMRRHGISKPDTSQLPDGNLEDWFKWFLKFLEGGERKGRSTLALYECPCGQKVRVGKKTWPGAVCKACGGEYQQARVEQVLYEEQEGSAAEQRVPLPDRRVSDPDMDPPAFQLQRYLTQQMN